MEKKATPEMMKKLRQLSRRLDKAPASGMVPGYIKNKYQMSMKYTLDDKLYDPKQLKEIIRFIEGMEEDDAKRGGKPRGRPLTDFL